MLTSQRKQYLLEILQRTGQIQAKAVSQELALSEDTIRRDLRELAAEGKLQRVHGGALPASAAIGDFTQRQHVATTGKAAIAHVAAHMIEPGQIVLLDGGTTAVQIARNLPPGLRATVVTHSPSVAVELVNHANVEVVMIGGRLFKHSVVNVGSSAIEAMARIRADLFFMGVTGVHAEAGLSTGDLEETYVKRALMARAAETYVLASEEKLNAASAYVIAKVRDVAGVIVNKEADGAALAGLRAAGVNLVLA